MRMRHLTTASAMRPARAFTLLEILVVMVIMALVLGIVVPRAVRMPSGVVFSLASNDFRSACRNAANRARCSGRICILSFMVNPDNHRLTEITIREQALPGTATPGGAGAPAAATAAEGKNNGGLREQGGAFGVAEVSSDYIHNLGLIWLEPEARVDASGTANGSGQVPSLLGAAFRFYPNGEASGEAIVVRAGKRTIQLTLDPLTARPIVAELEP